MPSEIEAREKSGYPPFGRLASLIVSGGDRHETESYARKLAAAAPLDEAVRVLGPGGSAARASCAGATVSGCW